MSKLYILFCLGKMSLTRGTLYIKIVLASMFKVKPIPVNFLEYCGSAATGEMTGRARVAGSALAFGSTVQSFDYTITKTNWEVKYVCVISGNNFVKNQTFF